MHPATADSERDIEAGMAKLLSARMARSCADNALQIHGGNRYAVEFPISRVFCDARILSVFEGSAEIQAQVIAKGLLRPPALTREVQRGRRVPGVSAVRPPSTGITAPVT